MLSRLARLALAAELAAYIAIGIWLHARGWNFAAIVAAALATLLGIRFGMVAASVTLSWLVASPRAAELQIGAWDTLKLVAAEYRAVLASNFINVPFEQLASPPEREPRPSERIPVVLVHGFFGNRGFFGQMLRWLEEEGVSPVFAPNLPATFSTIEHFADELHAAVERIVAGTGQPRVILVCHSMGGLAARRYVATRGAGRIAKIITIATPHAGTALAIFGLGANAAQMRRESAFLAALVREESRGKAALRLTSIYSVHDNLVAPQDTSRVEWARNVPIAGVGHITILMAPGMQRALLAELREAGVETRARG